MEESNHKPTNCRDKIILFIIGVLVGAIISTGAFVAYALTTNANSSDSSMQKHGTPPSKPDSNSDQESQDGQPPEMPDSENNEAPSDQNSSSNQSNKESDKTTNNS